MRVLARSCLVLVVVIAASGCGDDSGATSFDARAVDDAAPAPTWNNYARAFFESYCHGCHGPGDALRDYSQLSMVRAEQDTIACGVALDVRPDCTVNPGMFPVGNGPKPSADERAKLVQWIDSGAVE